MDAVSATYRLVTPLACSGADQSEVELRPATLRGLLRYWYRAADPAFRGNEASIFGGTGAGEGQSAFLLRVVHANLKPPNSLDLTRYRDLSTEAVRYHRPAGANRWTWQLNGMQYLGFSLKDHRKVVAPPGRFTVQLLFRTHPSQATRRAVLAALWLLGHVGGVGSRSRRAFGTVALESVSCGSANWPEATELPPAHGAESVDAWIDAFSHGLEVIKAWFGVGGPPARHATLTGSQYCLMSTGFRTARVGAGSFTAWERAMDAAGKTMQSFRQRWDLTNPASDYHAVKAHIADVDRMAAPAFAGGIPARLTGAPERAAFGLPLTFRYSSLGYPNPNNPGRNLIPSVTFRGNAHERSASPIHVRIVQIGDEAYPFFAWLPAPLLAPAEDVQWKVGRTTGAIAAPSGSLLNTFWTRSILPNGRGGSY